MAPSGSGEGKGKEHVLIRSTTPRGLSDEPEQWTSPRGLLSPDQGTAAATPGGEGHPRKQETSAVPRGAHRPCGNEGQSSTSP